VGRRELVLNFAAKTSQSAVPRSRPSYFFTDKLNTYQGTGRNGWGAAKIVSRADTSKRRPNWHDYAKVAAALPLAVEKVISSRRPADAIDLVSICEITSEDGAEPAAERMLRRLCQVLKLFKATAVAAIPSSSNGVSPIYQLSKAS
jgi:hypothetical protein